MDDDDRDFRRSKRHDSEMSSGGGGGVRKITAPIIGGGAGGRVPLGKKRGVNSFVDGGGVAANRCRNITSKLNLKIVPPSPLSLLLASAE